MYGGQTRSSRPLMISTSQPTREIFPAELKGPTELAPGLLIPSWSSSTPTMLVIGLSSTRPSSRRRTARSTATALPSDQPMTVTLLLPIAYSSWRKASAASAARRAALFARLACTEPKSWVVDAHAPGILPGQGQPYVDGAGQRPVIAVQKDGPFPFSVPWRRMRYQGNLFAERCRDHVQLLCGEQLTSHQLVGHSNARTGIDNPPNYCHPFLPTPSGSAVTNMPLYYHGRSAAAARTRSGTVSHVGAVLTRRAGLL